MTHKRVLSVVSLGVLLILVATVACTSKPTKKEEPVRRELNVRLQYSEAKQFDPAFTRRASEYFVTKNLFSGLVSFKPGTFEIEPDLAESYEVSPDGREYVFRLRKGVQFHKGYGECTAQDVVFTFDRLKDPECELSPVFKVIKSIDAPDNYTVRIVLDEPYAPLLTLLAYRNAFIVSKKAVTELGKDFAKSPVGTGPFVFQEMTPDKKVIVTANEEYFLGPPEVSKIIFHPIVEDEVAAMALEKGELDIIWTRGEAEIAKRLEANPDLTVKRAMSVTTRYVALNPKYEPLSKREVRQALAYALNKQAIFEATGGFELPAKSIFNPLFFAYSENVPQFEYNPDKARELLTQAGYPNGFPLTLLCSSRSPDPTVAQVIQESWRAVGINVTLNSMEHGAYSEAKDKGNYQAVLMGVGRPPDPDLVLMECFHSSAFPPGNNNSYYSGADSLIEQAARETDSAKRAELYVDLAAKILEDMPAVPVSNTMYAAAWRRPVVDYVPGINNEFLGYTIKLGR